MEPSDALKTRTWSPTPTAVRAAPGQGWPDPERSTLCSLPGAPGRECVRPIGARRTPCSAGPPVATTSLALEGLGRTVEVQPRLEVAPVLAERAMDRLHSVQELQIQRAGRQAGFAHGCKAAIFRATQTGRGCKSSLLGDWRPRRRTGRPTAPGSGPRHRRGPSSASDCLRNDVHERFLI